MAGYSKLYAVGGLGGFMGADGINPIEFMVLVGDADRQWLEPHYFDVSITPIGRLRVIVPAGPDHPDALLDACIAFCPRYFRSCPSLAEVEPALRDAERLDFDAHVEAIPEAWDSLREEARPAFAAMKIWQADLAPLVRNRAVHRPRNTDLPFFAYGLFRPGQLAYFQLRGLVNEVTDPAEVTGLLRLRDGLPIIELARHGSVCGALLTFLPDRAIEAYDRISAMEPDKHYRWQEAPVGGTRANVLVGRSPETGSVPCEAPEWNGWKDPLFTDALDVVEETLESPGLLLIDRDLKPLFRLQMAYLLLWSSIERYVSLRYHLGGGATQKVGELAREAAFVTGLRAHVHEKRTVYRADRPGEKEVLDPESPEKSVRYYYQVRSNITHRGKGVDKDYRLLHMSLTELLPIFREVLRQAEQDADLSA
jgi:hypothetical protein